MLVHVAFAFWWGLPDLHWHGFRHKLLRLACLLIPSSPHKKVFKTLHQVRMELSEVPPFLP